jgi:hypothetical protein
MSLRLPFQGLKVANSGWDFPLLSNLFDRYGPVPRSIYTAYYLGAYGGATTDAIEEVSQSSSLLRSLMLRAGYKMPDRPHKVICEVGAKILLSMSNLSVGM